MNGKKTPKPDGTAPEEGEKITAATPDLTPDQKAAQSFVTELRTRIATQPLPYAHGDEAAALQSLHDLFAQARKAIISNPGCKKFADVTVRMLNSKLRGFTAEWHRRSLAGELQTRDGGVAFRNALKSLRAQLKPDVEALYQMAYGSGNPDQIASDERPSIDLPSLGFGIAAAGRSPNSDWAAIDKAEADAINARRGDEPGTQVIDASGLAFSGGGIRSASFCLGVAQVLADKELLKDFDLLSTVSGGGYAGAFLTRRLAATGNLTDIASPNGPDPDAIRYLRLRASYLLTGSLARNLEMVGGILAGMILNWTALAAFLALVTTLIVTFHAGISAVVPVLPTVAGAVAAFGAFSYALLLRSYPGTARSCFAVLIAIAVLIFAVPLIQMLYNAFHSVLAINGVTLGAALAIAVPAMSRLTPHLNASYVRRALFALLLVLASIAVPLLGLVFSFALFDLGQQPQDLGLPWYNPLSHLAGVPLLWITTILLFLISIFAIDINLTGPQRIYRNGLARTFVALDDETDTEVALSSLDTENKAPYLLMNSVVNLPGSDAIELRERKGDFFLFSRAYCGSPTTGYRKTSDWKLGNSEIDLATAVATSGAAVSPHMALMTIRPVSALMTFLNIRLGLWLRKPTGHDNSGSGRPGWVQLLQEMSGLGLNGRKWLLLTDGAHLENSGVYELLRRRCKFIVALDASTETGDRFSTLMTLVRHARIDFGVDIDPTLDEIRTAPETGLAKAHGILCKIRYRNPAGGDPETGLLLFIKMTLTGDESELIQSYRAAHPKFPNQSSADQFFDEEQFEAYRQLGAHCANSLLDPALIGDPLPSSNNEAIPKKVPDWLLRLSRTILTDDS